MALLLAIPVCAAALVITTAHAAPASSVTVVPAPKEFTLRSGAASLASSTCVVVADDANSDAAAIARYAAAHLVPGRQLAVAPAAALPAARCFVAVVALGAATPASLRSLAQSRNVTAAAVNRSESYVLDVAAAADADGSSASIAIVCGDELSGCFYGVQSLRQLLAASSGGEAAAASRVYDWPSTRWRSTFVVHELQLNCGPLFTPNDGLDCAGGQVFNETFAEALLDYLAGFKLNLFVLNSRAPLLLAGDDASAAATARAALVRLRAFAKARFIELVPRFSSDDVPVMWPQLGEGLHVAGETFRFPSREAGEAAVPARPPAQLLVNGDFERGAHVGWFSVGPACRVVANATLARTGTHVAQCTMPPIPPGGKLTLSGYLSSECVPVSPGDVLRVSVWGTRDGTLKKCKDGGPSLFLTQYRSAPSKNATNPNIQEFPFSTFALSVNDSARDGWRQAGTSVVAMPGAKCVAVWTHAEGADPACKGSWRLDDVRLERTNSALQNVVRVPGETDVRAVDAATGAPLVLGRDLDVVDPPTPNRAGRNANFSWLVPYRIVRVGGGWNGSLFNVSYNFNPGSLQGTGGHFLPCFGSDTYRDRVARAVKATADALAPAFVFFNHDELRGIGRDSRTARGAATPASALASELNWLAEAAAPATAIFWDDMLNPLSNGGTRVARGNYGWWDGAGLKGMTGPALEDLDPRAALASWKYSNPATDPIARAWFNGTEAWLREHKRPFFASPGRDDGNVRAWAALLRGFPPSQALGVIGTTWSGPNPEAPPFADQDSELGWNLELPTAVAATETKRKKPADVEPTCVNVTICPSKCEEGKKGFGLIYPLGDLTQAPNAGLAAYRNQVYTKAAPALRSVGTITNTETNNTLHMTMLYGCCYTDAERATILQLFNGSDASWPPLGPGLRFDRAVCVQPQDNGVPNTGATRDIVVKLDAASQKIMEAWARTLEARMVAAGVAVTVPRADQVFFHSTIGHYNAADTPTPYPFAAGLAAVNAAVAPGNWTGGLGFGVQKVRCNGWQPQTWSGGSCPSWHPHPPMMMKLF